MKEPLFAALLLLLANTASFAAQKCPAIETWVLDKGFYEVAPWRVVSGGALPATPALSLGSAVCSNSERGLLGGANDTSRPHSSRKQPLEERVESGIGKATK